MKRISITELRKPGRPKGTFKVRKTFTNEEIDEMLIRMDEKIKEIQDIQKNISIALKCMRI